MESIQNFEFPSAPVQTPEYKPVNTESTEDKKSGFRQMLESKQEEGFGSEQVQMEEPKQDDVNRPELEQLAAMQMFSFQPVILPDQAETVVLSGNVGKVLQMHDQKAVLNVITEQPAEMAKALQNAAETQIVQENPAAVMPVSESVASTVTPEIPALNEMAGMPETVLSQKLSANPDTAKTQIYEGIVEQPKLTDAVAQNPEKQSAPVNNMLEQGSTVQDHLTRQISTEDQIRYVMSFGKENQQIKPEALQSQSQETQISEIQPQGMQGQEILKRDVQPQEPKTLESQYEAKAKNLTEEQGTYVIQQSAVRDNTSVKVSETPEMERKSSIPAPQKQVLQRIETLMKSGERKVTMQLEPHNLGKIRIELVQKEDGNLYVVLHAQNKEVQKLLEQHIPEMQQLLQSDTHQEVQVQVPAQQEHEQQEFYDQQQGGRQGQQNPEQQHKQEHKQDFLNQLRLGLLSDEV